MNWRSSILILTLSFPIILNWAYFKLSLQKVRYDVEERRSSGFEVKEIKQLKFSKKEITTKLRWEHSREFEYLGEMYDIITQDDCNDSITYICYWDIEETKLKKQMNKIYYNDDDNQPDQHKKGAKLLEYFKQLYIYELVTIFENRNYYPIYLRNIINKKKSIFSKFYNVVPSPPPEL